MARMTRASAVLLLALGNAACVDRLLTPDTERHASLAVGDAVEGEYFRVGPHPAIYLSYGGSRYAVPDLQTLYACTGSFPGVVQSRAEMPALADGGALPAVGVHGWMGGEMPVRGEDSPAVYAVVGCVKSPIPDLATLFALYGEGPQVVTVPQALIDGVPTGPLARAPLRRPGALIQGPGTAEVRWVTFMGGALAVASGEALDSYCRFGADREPEQVDAAEWAAYPATGVLGVSASDCETVQPPIVRDGEIYRIEGSPVVYLAQQGQAWQIPDLETLAVCTGGHPGVVRTLLRAPALRDGGALPSVTTHPFMSGDMAVRSEGHPAVFAVIGCVRSAVPDPETFFAVFGPSGASRTVTVADALLAQVPRFGTVRLPLRRPGTLIRTEAGAAIRWVTHVGGALAVPDLATLASHCRTSVVVVSAEEFAAFPARARLEPGTAVCPGIGSPALQPDFRLPLGGGLAWHVVTAAGEGENVGERRYALDFLPLTEGLPSAPPVAHNFAPVLAAAPGTVSHIGVDAHLGTWILLTHESGFNTIYGHLREDAIGVLPGETVVRGQFLGIVGSSGQALEPRLHFEVRRFEQGGGSAHAVVLDQVVLEGRNLADFSAGEFHLSSNPQISLAIAAPRPRTLVTANTAQNAHACAIRDDGSAVCWGDNQFGQLGNGNFDLSMSTEPVAVVGGHRFVALSSGINHICGITTAGPTVCWGNNVQGQLGAGTGPNQWTPVTVAGGHSFIELSGGGNTTCGLTAAGAVWCWGNNNVGQLGDGTTDTRTTPVPTALPVPAAAIAVTDGFGCALGAGGDAYCWGNNNAGQVGGGTTGGIATLSRHVVTGERFRHISVGMNTACAINLVRKPLCWGALPGGGAAAVPTAVHTSATFVALAVSGSAACGIAPDGQVYCWGSNAGRFGLHDQASPPTPTRMSDGIAFDQVVLGGNWACGITTAADARCWGVPLRGVLGNGAWDGEALPVQALLTGAVRSVTADLPFSCALRTDDAAFCWGQNNQGQLGIGSAGGSVWTPTAVVGGHAFKSISAGGAFACGLTEAGAAWCWGNSADGRLGVPVGMSTTGVPVQVGGGHAFRSIATGSAHACGLTAASDLYCWGLNSSGQFGVGSTADVGSAGPILAGGGQKFETVMAGTAHSCGIGTDNVTYCWGFNGNGRLGDGTSINRTVPTPIAGSHQFASLHGHPAAAITCALTESGAAYCWGANNWGQLGDGTQTPRAVPTAVVGGHTFIDLAVGFRGVCGVRSDFRLFCWGDNANAQFGAGSMTRGSPSPVPAGGGLLFSQAALGELSSCGVRTSGEVLCWGNRNGGRLGAGSFESFIAPVPVIGGYSYRRN